MGFTLILAWISIPLFIVMQSLAKFALVVSVVRPLIRPAEGESRLAFWEKTHPILKILAVALTVCGFWTACVTWNQAFPKAHRAGVKYFVGYLFLAWVPLLARFSLRTWDWAQVRRKYFNVKVAKWVWVGILVVTCAVAWSQWQFGWKLQGSSWVPSETRGRGFYSHPLTLSYVLLWFWPWTVWNMFRWLGSKSKRSSWMIPFQWVVCGALMYFADSRTAMSVALLELLVIGTFLLPRRKALSVWGIAVACVVSLLLTENRISNRFVASFDSASPETQVSEGFKYKNDRMVFWHAHWKMFLNKPWTGYGASIPKEVRYEAYAAIGQSQFKKKYNAHNYYLETLVRSGLVGLGLFLIWVAIWLRAGWVMLPREWRLPFVVMVLGWLAASLTQNSLDDSEVRYSLLVFWSALLVFSESKSKLVECIES